MNKTRKHVSKRKTRKLKGGSASRISTSRRPKSRRPKSRKQNSRRSNMFRNSVFSFLGRSSTIDSNRNKRDISVKIDEITRVTTRVTEENLQTFFANNDIENNEEIKKLVIEICKNKIDETDNPDNKQILLDIICLCLGDVEDKQSLLEEKMFKGYKSVHSQISSKNSSPKHCTLSSKECGYKKCSVADMLLNIELPS